MCIIYTCVIQLSSNYKYKQSTIYCNFNIRQTLFDNITSFRKLVFNP